MNEDELNESNLFRIRAKNIYNESFPEINSFNFTFPTMITPSIKYQDVGPDKILMTNGDEYIPEFEDSNFYNINLETNHIENSIIIQDIICQKKNSKPIELYWEKLYIKVEHLKKTGTKSGHDTEEKFIIKDSKGVVKPGTFTAILGPSGSGKTTLLNFLSGRIAYENLKIYGRMKINGNEVQNIDCIAPHAAYVMQDDILFATMTPREAFKFAAALRLNCSAEEKYRKVENLINDLGLRDCANTLVGNTLIRGISGGERKRTSIGIELMNNPSLIFLDEPTTGLDSATALNVLLILKNLANSGRTIVSTIHQPSSEIFSVFDKLMLLVQGEIIYQGNAHSCLNYFNDMGFKSPPFCNPAIFLMKCMNPEGLLIESMQNTNNFSIEFNDEIKKEFEKRLYKMVNNYKNSNLYGEIQSTVISSPTNFSSTIHEENNNSVSLMTQCFEIAKREIKNEIRDPMDIKMKFGSLIFCIVSTIIVFYGLGDYRAGIQNRMGVLFFLQLINGFAGLLSSLLLCTYYFFLQIISFYSKVSLEKPIFLRERLSNTYTTSSYFLGKTTSQLPVDLAFPIISVALAYYTIGLDDNIGKFFILTLTEILVFFNGVSLGQFLSIIFPEPETALTLIPVLNVPLLFFAGFFSNQNNTPYFFYPIQYISMYRYGFQASVQNELGNKKWECAPPNSNGKKDYCDPLGEQEYSESLFETIIILFFIGLAIRILAFVSLYFISNQKRPKVERPEKLNLIFN